MVSAQIMISGLLVQASHWALHSVWSLLKNYQKKKNVPNNFLMLVFLVFSNLILSLLLNTECLYEKLRPFLDTFPLTNICKLKIKINLKTISFNNGGGRTWDLIGIKWSLAHIFHKKYLSIKAKTVKCWEENMGDYLCDLECR